MGRGRRVGGSRKRPPHGEGVCTQVASLTWPLGEEMGVVPWRKAAVSCILTAAALFVAGWAAREAGAPVWAGSSAGASGGQVTWRGRELFLPAAGQPSRPLRVPYPVLQVLPVSPPGRGEQLLVLTAERPSGSQPRRSHLYRLDPHRPGSLVPLSPEPTRRGDRPRVPSRSPLRRRTPREQVRHPASSPRNGPGG